ncbi:MAG TPA: hypothetical protein VFE34_05365 [Dongiaceae bacterium]|jgi:hypothetical protein|nr:hypothetical protein [Dongiaceae bacterium]
MTVYLRGSKYHVEFVFKGITVRKTADTDDKKIAQEYEAKLRRELEEQSLWNQIVRLEHLSSPRGRLGRESARPFPFHTYDVSGSLSDTWMRITHRVHAGIALSADYLSRYGLKSE